MENAVFELDEGFGRSSRDLDVGAREVEHIRRRIDRAQHPVGVEQAALKRSAEAVGEHDLEYIALADVVLCAFDHCAVLFLVKQRSDLAFELTALFGCLFAVFEQAGELLQVGGCFVVAVFTVLDPHVDDKNYFLTDVVKGDNLVKKHKVNVLERLVVLDLALYAGFAVAEVIVGEVAYQAACERRKIIEPRAFVFREQTAQIVRRVVGAHLGIACLHLAVDAGDLHFGVKAEEGVATPAVVCLRGFEHVAVRGNRFEYLHRLDRGCEVREQLAAERQNIVIALCGDFLCFGKRG